MRRVAAKALVAAAVIAASAGVYSIGQAGYMLAKAEIAQILLERAWERTMGGEENVRAWPWADVRPVAHLDVPRLDEHAIVLSDTSGEALAFGPGPVGGEATLTDGRLKIIAAHRDSHFEFIKDVRPGDEITLTLADGITQTYRISRGLVVDTTSYKMPRPVSDGLALVTCWPFVGETGGPLRLILFGDLISDSEEAPSNETPDI